MSWENDQDWQLLLAERDGLRLDRAAIDDVVRRHHDDHHAGAACWCDAALCRLLFRPRTRREPGSLMT